MDFPPESIPPSLSPRPTAAVPPSTVTFSQVISAKLSEKNYFIWKQQVEAVLASHRLERYVVNPQVPLRFLSEDDREFGRINPAFLQWEEQDQHLVSWLLQSLSESVQSRVLGLRHAWQIWDEIHTFFDSLIRARSQLLLSELRTIKKGTQTVTEFVSRVKALIHSLAAVGEIISGREQVRLILEGLPSEYEAFVTSINNRAEVCTFIQLESLLMAHETYLERIHPSTQEVFSVNVARSSSQFSAAGQHQSRHNLYNDKSGFSTQVGTESAETAQMYHPVVPPPGRGRGSYFGRGRGGRFGRGRSGSVRCQLCYKAGHEALQCWYRFDLVMQSQLSPSSAQFAPPFSAQYAPPVSAHYAPPVSAPVVRPFAHSQFQHQPIRHYNNNTPPMAHVGFHQNSVLGPAPMSPAHSYADSFHPTQGQPSPHHLPVTVEPQAYNSQLWYPDSGATHHITSDSSNLMHSAGLPGSDSIFMGNGSGAPITG
ncbi:PREDICTED: uncharacterized protein LOC109352047 [Lupinus angustifolius]|uniref:uncharacterized protein LOC109328125 n=1 Tax=Lupinus angustifolius TaxID=3871 RepID=UPI00092F53EE|nr:PREDICTED: uncharacterized protein LOC109328125 [Lupinus angustifolius]XP_019449377.1 PREDICTED: uncharacterized protein LOC109352047 [Lupinus angustifolius]